MLPLRYSRDKRMDIDSINSGTPASKGWLHPVCGVLHATDLYADNPYLTSGGSGMYTRTARASRRTRTTRPPWHER